MCPQRVGVSISNRRVHSPTPRRRVLPSLVGVSAAFVVVEAGGSNVTSSRARQQFPVATLSTGHVLFQRGLHAAVSFVL